MAGIDSETSLGGIEEVLINHQNHVSSSGTDDSTGMHMQSALDVVHGGVGNVGGVSVIGSGIGGQSLFGTAMTPIDKLYSMQSSYFTSTDCECIGANP